MDDDRKVDSDSGSPEPSNETQLVEQSKMVFLREIINEFKRKQQQYDLGSEFAKTKRNRSPWVPGVIIALIVVFTGVVIGVTQYIQNSSRSIQVNIEDFADVNLRDILDEAQRLQNQLEQAERELETLLNARDQRVAQVERQRDRDISLLADEQLSATQRAAREQELTADAERRIAAIRAEYQPGIEELEARIADLEARIAEYDSRQLEQAREQEEVLNNQQRVFDLQIEELRESYEQEIALLTENYESQIEELEAFQQEFERTIRQRHAAEIAALTRRYNPDFSGEQVGELLGAAESNAASRFDGPAAYRDVLGAEGAIDAQGYRQLASGYREFQQIVSRLQQVPYQNSVPPALTQIDRRARDLLAQYDSIWQTLGSSVISRDEVIAEQSSEIEQFLYALDEYATFNGDIGYILDPRDPQEVVVYINSVRTVDVGSLGYVFRRDDEFVGTIRFVREDDRMIARQVDTAEDMELQAFDRVLIEVE